MPNTSSASNHEWEYSPYVGWGMDEPECDEIGRNDSPDVLRIPGPYPLSERWLAFWLMVYRARRWFKRTPVS